MDRKLNLKIQNHVKKWVDYRSKYGLGYLLSNGSTGAFFNDHSIIIMDPKGMQSINIKRQSYYKILKVHGEKQDWMQSHPLNDYPKERQKKVILLQHFRRYLEGDNFKNTTPDRVTDPEDSLARLVYVKKWMKTSQYIIFRLSNNIFQVNFTDKTEVILSSENKMVTYLNKKGEILNYPLATAEGSSNTEMAKRQFQPSHHTNTIILDQSSNWNKEL